MKKTLSLIGILSIITIIIFIAGCNKQSIVEKGDLVEITYTANFPDGSLFKTNEGQEPLRFVVGAGEVIKGLDEQIIGKKLNKTYTIQISPEKGYASEYDKMKIQKIAKNIFEMSKLSPIEGQKLKLGEDVGLIRKIEKDEKGNEYVLFDINPPYTYEALTYKISIKKIEKQQVNKE